jgi:phage/plasmid-associated DNA primase
MKIVFKAKKLSTDIVMEETKEQFNPIKMEIKEISPKSTPTFYTLNDAKEALVDSVNEVIISTPKKEDPRKKVFLIKHKNKLARFLEKNPHRSIFEVFHQYPFKMCYDFDHKKTDTSLNFEDYTKLVTEFIGQVFNDHDLSISGSTSEKKHSLHLVSPNYIISNDSDLNHVKNIIRFCHENIQNEDGQKLLNDFDDSIYKKNGSMKMIYQSKHGEQRYQNPLNNTSSDFISNHFITCDIPTFAESISTHTIDGLEEIKTKQVQLDQKMAEYKKPSDTEIMEYLDIISTKYLDNYGDWSKIVLSAKSAEVDFVYMCYISAKSLSYDGNTYANFDDFLDRYNPHSINRKLVELWDQSNNPMTVGSIKHYAKLSDEAEYKNICFKYKPEMDIFLSLEDLKSPYNIAHIIKPVLTHLKYCGGVWYSYNSKSGLWKSTKDCNYFIIEALYKQINKQIKDLVHKNEACTHEERDANLKTISKLSASLNKIDSKSICSQITGHLKHLLEHVNFDKQLDILKNRIAFKNGVYDLRTKTFRLGFQLEDYLTTCLDVVYNPTRDNKKEAFVLSTLKKILNNNDEHLAYYLSVMGYSLIGDPEKEKSIYYLIGNKGNNGKTLILDVLTHIMPQYVSKIDSKLLDCKYTKKHKIINGIKSKRIIWGDEFAKSTQIDIETLKVIADGKPLPNEVMFGTSEDINLQGKLFIVSNHTPSMVADGGVSNRYRQIEFNSHFGDYVDDYVKLRFKKDVYLADKLKEHYANDIINLLMDYASMYYTEGLKPMPEEFRLATQETLELNNHFQTWFNDNCEVSPNFKISKDELLNNIDMTFKELKDELKRIDFKYNKDLRGFDKLNGKYPKGGFIGFRIIPRDDFIDEDELN